jgi:hypothetical protein
MTSFNFQSIQSLEISAQDKPTIDVRDGHLVLTAERGQERIVITAPLQGIMPKVAATKIKTPKRTSKYNGGSKNNNSKLNDETVRAIRLRINDSKFKATFKNTPAMYKELALTYKVSVWTIKNIAENISWKHVIV